METREILEERLKRTARLLGIELSGQTMDQLEEYLSELYKWNSAYNLVGRKTTWEGLVEHAVDSLTPLLFTKLFQEGIEALDLGSGAGFPGYPLYIVAGPFSLTLAEPLRKRYSFLRHIKRTLSLEKVTVLPLRGEEMARMDQHLNAFDLIFARAVMDFSKTMKLAQPLLSSGGRLLLFLGKKDSETLSRASKALPRQNYKLEYMRSVKKLTGKDNFVAAVRKQEKV